MMSKHKTNNEAPHMNTAAKGQSRVGRILCDRYRLEAVIGTGAMGKVYQAMDLPRRQRCAIKLVLPEADRSLQAHRRFSNEAKVVASLFHPNIVTVLEFNEDSDGTEFMVLELLEGMDLHELLNMHRQLPLKHGLDILRSVGSALQYAHDLGIIHRDIKPENIFLSRQRSPLGHISETVKVLDFGLAKHLPGEGGPKLVSESGEGRLTQGLTVGTPAYLSPEATLEHSRIDERSDQWSLAVVAYQMFSGRLPFDHENPFSLCHMICTAELVPMEQLVPDLPTHIWVAIERALSKDPAQRFPRVHDFIRALDNLSAVPKIYGERRNNRLQRLQLSASADSSQGEANPEHSDTLGAVQPGLAADRALWIHREEFARPAASSLSEPEPRPDTDIRKTVQYSADELLALAFQSKPLEENVPVTVGDDEPTIPYHMEIHDEIAAASPKSDRSAQPEVAAAADNAAGATHVLMPPAQATIIFQSLGQGLDEDLGATIQRQGILQVQAAQKMLTCDPLMPEKTQRAVLSIPLPILNYRPVWWSWIGIGASVAAFCICFLIAMLIGARQGRSRGNLQPLSERSERNVKCEHGGPSLPAPSSCGFRS